MQETVDHFKRISLAGCIFTKLDECLSLGEIINVAIQNALPVSYLTNGQRVPEDIDIAEASRDGNAQAEQLRMAHNSSGHQWYQDGFDPDGSRPMHNHELTYDQASGLRRMKQQYGKSHCSDRR